VKYFVIGGTTALNNACGVYGILHTDEIKASLGYLAIKKVGNRLGLLEVSENLIHPPPSRHEALTLLH
jgi:hypothetical protein